MKGPFPEKSPYGEIGRTGSPDAYLIDPGAGSASDRVSRFWPVRHELENITSRDGEITPLYARRDGPVPEPVVSSAARSWESCPVCTTQCTLNECRNGCAIASPYKD